jgi:hypothetical protein
MTPAWWCDDGLKISRKKTRYERESELDKAREDKLRENFLWWGGNRATRRPKSALAFPRFACEILVPRRPHPRHIVHRYAVC